MIRRRVHPRSRAGFTLVELTVAVVLLAVGLLAVAGTLTRAFQQIREGRQRHNAVRAAESVADSVSHAGGDGEGGVAAGALRIDWRPEPCPVGLCVRVVARVESSSSDSVSLLARMGAARP